MREETGAIIHMILYHCKISVDALMNYFVASPEITKEMRQKYRYISEVPKADGMDGKTYPVTLKGKVARSMGWLIDAIEQVNKYTIDLKNAKYEIQGKEVPAPTIFLVVTPESWSNGHLYEWTPPEFQYTGNDSLLTKYQEGEYFGSWFTMTFLYERLLMKHGATLIRKQSFFTNMLGNHGAVTRYGLNS
jgi:hypothetical protein